MWARLITGFSALGVYGWTLDDPKRAFNIFYDVSNWLTSHVLSGDGTLVRMTRNFFNDLLIDQFKGFLLGIAVATLLSVLFWPFKAGTRWASGKVAKAIRGTKGSSRQEHNDPKKTARQSNTLFSADARIDEDPEPGPAAPGALRR